MTKKFILNESEKILNTSRRMERSFVLFAAKCSLMHSISKFIMENIILKMNSLGIACLSNLSYTITENLLNVKHKSKVSSENLRKRREMDFST